MLKLIGIVLIVGSCSAIGISINGVLGRRVQTLRGFICAFQIVKAEVVFRFASTSEILQDICEQCGGGAGYFFKSAQKLMSKERIPLWSAADRLIPMLSQYGISETQREQIARALSAMGRYDAHQQAQALDIVIAQLEDELISARKEHGEKGKLYRAVGLSAGIMLALVIM